MHSKSVCLINGVHVVQRLQTLEMVMIVPSLRNARMSTMKGGKSYFQIKAINKKPTTTRMITRERRMALMIVLKPGSVRTMSAASLAASVAPATAMPMSAFLSAGASLTPSPVMATKFYKWEQLKEVFVALYTNKASSLLDYGLDLAAAMQLPIVKPFAHSTLLQTETRLLIIENHSRANSRRPVIILTLTPSSRAFSIVSAVSWRGGSSKGKRPMKRQGPPVSWLRVNVPVLSLHRMSMPAISSMAVIRFTIAPCLCQSVASRASASYLSLIVCTCLARWWEPMAMVTDSTVGMAIGMPPINSTRRLLMPFLYLRFCMANITIASMRMPMKMDTMQKLPIIASTCRPRTSQLPFADLLEVTLLVRCIHQVRSLAKECRPACMLTLSRLHLLPSCSLAMTLLSAPTAQQREPRICRDDVAAPDANEISRHQVRCLHLLPGSVTKDLLTKLVLSEDVDTLLCFLGRQALRACLELIPDLIHGGMLLCDDQSAAQCHAGAGGEQATSTGRNFSLAKLVLRGHTTGIEPRSERLQRTAAQAPGQLSQHDYRRPLLVMDDCCNHSQGLV
eukprot:SM000039S14480  [mRNA]  locus=s39:305275:312361:- [translate_table: standard]